MTPSILKRIEGVAIFEGVWRARHGGRGVTGLTFNGRDPAFEGIVFVTPGFTEKADTLASLKIPLDPIAAVFAFKDWRGG